MLWGKGLRVQPAKPKPLRPSISGELQGDSDFAAPVGPRADSFVIPLDLKERLSFL